MSPSAATKRTSANDPRLPCPPRRSARAVREFLPGAKRRAFTRRAVRVASPLRAVSTQTLVSYALDEGVDFAPGHRFFANPTDGEQFLRLNFATRTPDEINQGTQRLDIALQRANREALAEHP